MTVDCALQSSPDIFTPYECLGLWVGALCHDLDHRYSTVQYSTVQYNTVRRGYNNKFMLDSQSPLARVYSSSTMENHHFAMGVSILQQV